MDTKEKIALAQDILNGTSKKTNESFKYIKSDKGLIERAESSKTILTENNKEMLFG